MMAVSQRRILLFQLVVVCLLIGCVEDAVSETTDSYGVPSEDDRCPVCPKGQECRRLVKGITGASFTTHHACMPVNLGRVTQLNTSPALDNGRCKPLSNGLFEAFTAIELIIVVDQSKGMAKHIDWLKAFVPQLNTEMEAANTGSAAACPNLYAIVGFARKVDPHPTIYTTPAASTLFPITDFANVSSFVRGENGFVEDGYLAIATALKGLPLRRSTPLCNVTKHILFVTDEDRDTLDTSLDRRKMDALLHAYQIELHAMVDNKFLVDGLDGAGLTARGIGYREVPSGSACFRNSSNAVVGRGYSMTTTDYVSLALQTGGTAWNIERLQVPSVQRAIQCALVQEIQQASTSQHGVLYNCSCNSMGPQQCQPVRDLEKEEYDCMKQNGLWSSGICVRTNGECVPHTDAIVKANTAVDFIMVVDQTPSMRKSITWLNTFVPQFNTEMESANVGTAATCQNQYAVVGFGLKKDPFQAIYHTQNGSTLFPIADFADVSRRLKEAGGRFEDGYFAMYAALSNLPLRNSTRNCQVKRSILLMTNEHRNTIKDARFRSLDRAKMKLLLKRYKIELHVMVDNQFVVGGFGGVGVDSRGIGYMAPPNSDVCFNISSNITIQDGFDSTMKDYVTLALETGGTAWDIERIYMPAAQAAIRCGLVHVIRSSSTFPQGNCFNCSCNSLGREECQPAGSMATRQCACLRDGGLLSHGKCVFSSYSCSPGSRSTRLEREIANVATDFLLIVEQNGFMQNLIERFSGMIEDVYSRLLQRNIGTSPTCRNHLMAVGFGPSRSSPQLYTAVNGTVIDDLGRVASHLSQNASESSSTADGYQAIQYALDNIRLRPSSTVGCKRSRNMILLSDEDRIVPDGYPAVTRGQLFHRLSAESIKLHTVIYSSFLIPDVVNVIGRSASAGFSLADTSKSCFQTHPSVRNNAPFGDTTRDYTELALALDGTAWDINQLNSEPARKSMACALATVTSSGLKAPGEYCITCACSGSGDEKCSSQPASAPGRCNCEQVGYTWRNGSCRTMLRMSSTIATDIPAEQTSSSIPVKQSSMTLVIAAAAGAAVACVALLLVLLALILRQRWTTKRDMNDLKAVNEATRDVVSATHNMMAMMVAPAGSRLKVIPPEALSFGICIGKGQYGEVYLGHLATSNGIDAGDGETVAIKLMRCSDGSEATQSRLLEEYFLQQSVGEHPNIVRVLLGGLYKAEPCIVMEYMAGGDLLQFLRNVKVTNQMMDKNDIPFLHEREKLDISRQIALGLEFLASKQIVHRDIAARNMLVREHLTIPGKLEVKISDWGLSRKAETDGAYQAQTSRMLPVKWMAVESVETGAFSEKTDVWSFGVLMWEVETGGEVPYAHTPNALLVHLVQTGHRLDKPAHCTSFVYSLMLRCWEEDPSERPTFSELTMELTSSYELEMSYMLMLGDIDIAAARGSTLSLSHRMQQADSRSRPTESALLTVIHHMRHNSAEEEYVPMSPQTIGGECDFLGPQQKTEPGEEPAPRYILGQPTSLPLPVEDRISPSLYTPPADYQADDLFY